MSKMSGGANSKTPENMSTNKFPEPLDEKANNLFDKFALNQNLNKVEEELMNLERNLADLKLKFKAKLQY